MRRRSIIFAVAAASLFGCPGPREGSDAGVTDLGSAPPEPLGASSSTTSTSSTSTTATVTGAPDPVPTAAAAATSTLGASDAPKARPTPGPEARALPPGAPEWVKAGSGASGDAIWVVARAAGIRNRGLARTTADNRARAALARALESEPAPRVAATLRGVEITDHWTDPRTGTIFARARLARAPDEDPR